MLRQLDHGYTFVRAENTRVFIIRALMSVKKMMAIYYATLTIYKYIYLYIPSERPPPLRLVRNGSLTWKHGQKFSLDIYIYI